MKMNDYSLPPFPADEGVDRERLSNGGFPRQRRGFHV
jgi:hypothetical protein